ncbi:hypothetical protein MSAN_00171000 [Mycena sanguinolenta]|uniref:Uncharacterized protein n=1 Tax=Mycena sanguinolenta TaxID=230812 RepID=A0A8H6ZEE0_9AGAR|nr:hypothetical protein MSAN_00171000 [Mycena sanguinolenta]
MDPTYVVTENSEPETELDSKLRPSSSTQAQEPQKRKQNFDGDLIPDRKLGKVDVSHTTEWRNKKGMTKKARVVNMHHKIASFFKESEEPDSDLEIVEPVHREDILMSDPVPLALDNFPSDLNAPIPEISVSSPEIHDPAPPLEADRSSTTIPSIPAASLADESAMTQASVAPKPAVHTGLNETEVKAKHTKLHVLIKKHKKALSTKDSLISNTKAASFLLDLKALSQYNDKLLELSLKKIKLVASVKTTCPLLHPKLWQKISSSCPFEEASLAVSHCCRKGSYYARVLRKMVAQLLSDGTLLEKHQGASAHHESLLNNPAIRDTLQEWVKWDSRG